MDQPNLAPAADPAQPIVTPELHQDPNAAPVDGGAPVVSEPAAPEGQTQPDDKPNPRKAEFRFAELTRQRNEAERRAATLEGELAAYRRLGLNPAAQTQPQAVAPDGPPNPDDYYGGVNDPVFIEDRARHAARQVIAEEREADEQRRTFEQGRSAFLGVLSEADRAMKSFPDEFANAPVVLEYIGSQKDTVTADLIAQSENPVHLAEFLGRNDAELTRIMRLPPLQRARAIGAYDAQISARLAPPPQPAPAPAMNAPAPTPAPTPTPTVHGGRTPQAPSIQQIQRMSPAEYREFRSRGGTF